jgi:hypothetical protein
MRSLFFSFSLVFGFDGCYDFEYFEGFGVKGMEGFGAVVACVADIFEPKKGLIGLFDDDADFGITLLRGTPPAKRPEIGPNGGGRPAQLEGYDAHGRAHGQLIQQFEN